jgi:hypothetical protein
MATSTPLSMVASEFPVRRARPRETASTRAQARARSTRGTAAPVPAPAVPPASARVRGRVSPWTATSIQGSHEAPPMRSMWTIWLVM